MLQRDYILRMIEQAAQAIARALGLLAERKHEEAQEQLASAYASLGLDRELVLVLDATTLARQLGAQEKIAAAARLLLAGAKLHAARGEHSMAHKHLRVARKLSFELDEPDAELEATLDDATNDLDR